MKSSLKTVLFAMVVSVSACGDRVSPSPTETSHPAPPKQGGASDPVAEVPQVPKAEFGKAPIVEIAMPTKYVDIIKLANELVAKGEHPRARELFEAAAKLDKKQAEPHIELARSYITTGDRALAIKAANKAVKLAPESSQAYNTLGRAELLRHGYEDALIAFRQATELNADNAWAWNNLGYTNLLLKRYQDAADALVEATSRKGATAFMWNNLGTAYEHLDELDDARVAFETGGKLGSSQAKASRKRLDGVDSIIVMRTDKPAVEHSYETAEPMPDIPDPEIDDVTEEAPEEMSDDDGAEVDEVILDDELN